MMGSLNQLPMSARTRYGRINGTTCKCLRIDKRMGAGVGTAGGENAGHAMLPEHVALAVGGQETPVESGSAARLLPLRASGKPLGSVWVEARSMWPASRNNARSTRARDPPAGPTAVDRLPRRDHG